MASLDAMHAEVLRTRPGFVKMVEREMKSVFSSMCGGVRVSVVSRGLLTYPPASCCVALKDIFPVLDGAEVVSMGNQIEKVCFIGIS